MKRRSFFQFAGASAVALAGSSVVASSAFASSTSSSALGVSSGAQKSAQKRLFPPALPPALKSGMKVGIPAPASGVAKEDFEKKVKAFSKTLEELGLTPVVAKSVMAGASYLAAPDEVRAAEFMEFVKNPDIGAIICIRGGYGVMRILPMLDFAAIEQNPKIISGFSDITALVNAVYQRCNLVAFHGPMGAAELDDFTRRWFLPQVFPATTGKSRFEPLVFADHASPMTSYVGGKARGRVVGGNLTMITALMGTPYDVETDGAVLFLEDVGEKPYKVDRMLTQMWLAGKLQKCAAIVIGQFTDGEDTFYPTVTMEEVFRSRLAPLKIPVLANFPLGHVKEKFTMPIGALAEVDADAKSFTLLEPSVRW
jgi:muramoyltetrapeptide carboxypeptidase